MSGAIAGPRLTILGGAEWLLKATEPDRVLTPERVSDEQRFIARTTKDFVANEVLPALDRLEQKDWTLTRDLLKRCGALGLLSVDVAEAYGGLDLDKATSMIVSENMAGGASFSTTFGAQANLTVLPLSLFGTDAQKRKYLPRLMTGELVGAYCLSEPGSGSDALGAKTTATRQPDGSFVLNGEKMWITNGGFADLFIVFAKVREQSADLFTAFLVERSFAGVASGHEERKMGLHGSSTTPIILQNVLVPADNVLGEVGKGHKLAFNVLNFGRFKLGAMCVGGARIAIGEAARYAAQRKQFGQPIASFGAIKAKLGEMVVRTYGIESMIYRTAGMIDARVEHSTTDRPAAAVAALEEYAIEASLAKVAGSEVLDRVLDENIQIHGGNGFVRDYPAERHYRDARVNRIFEGTNEINRLLAGGMVAKRAAKGDVAILAAARALQDELTGPMTLPEGDERPLAAERQTIDALKKAALMVLGMSMQTYGSKLADEQEVLMYIADILIDVYAADSACLRALAVSSSDSRAQLHADTARVFVSDAALRVDAAARQAFAAMLDGDALRTTLAALRRLLKVSPINTVQLRRRLADESVASGGYVF